MSSKQFLIIIFAASVAAIAAVVVLKLLGIEGTPVRAGGVGGGVAGAIGGTFVAKAGSTQAK